MTLVYLSLWKMKFLLIIDKTQLLPQKITKLRPLLSFGVWWHVVLHIGANGAFTAVISLYKLQEFLCYTLKMQSADFSETMLHSHKVICAEPHKTVLFIVILPRALNLAKYSSITVTSRSILFRAWPSNPLTSSKSSWLNENFCGIIHLDE
jgi:hypothetical protein